MKKKNITIITLAVLASFSINLCLIPSTRAETFASAATTASAELATLTGSNKDDFISKQNAFYKVMDLADAELKNLNKNLDQISVEDNSDYARIKTMLLEKISDFRNYNQEIRVKISEANNVDDLKNLAIKFKNWREKYYAPETEIIIDFSLVLKEKDIFATATERFEKIKKDVEKLTNLKLEQTQQFNSLLDSAKNYLNLTNESIEKAEKTLYDYLSSQLSIATSTESIENTDSSTISSTENIKISTSSLSTINNPQFDSAAFQGFIKDGFENIKAVYEIFLKMSNLIK